MNLFLATERPSFRLHQFIQAVKHLAIIFADGFNEA